MITVNNYKIIKTTPLERVRNMRYTIRVTLLFEDGSSTLKTNDRFICHLKNANNTMSPVHMLKKPCC